MQAVSAQIDEATELQVDDNNALETVRMGLREVTLTKRKEDRVLTWSKNRASLGDFSKNEFFSIDYVVERAKLLKKKKILLEDYRYLPNAFIQVHLIDLINFVK